MLLKIPELAVPPGPSSPGADTTGLRSEYTGSTSSFTSPATLAPSSVRGGMSSRGHGRSQSAAVSQNRAVSPQRTYQFPPNQGESHSNNNLVASNDVGLVDPVINDPVLALIPIGVNHKTLNKVVLEQVNMLLPNHSVANPRMVIVLVDPWVEDRFLDSLRECQVV